jgi:hypothetical protein
MKFLRAHWYDIGTIPMAVTLIYLIFNWDTTEVLQKIALMNFFVIFWHQFEEYRFPGGEPAITNLAMQPSAEGEADCCPLNQNNAMVINVVAAYTAYLLPVFFPDILWLGFMPILFGMSQLIMHGILTPRKIGNRIYSPGLCAVFFGHVPLGIFWFYYTISDGLLGWSDVLFGLIYQGLFIVVFMRRIGYGLLAGPGSKYKFPQEEFERGGYAEKIRRLQSAGQPD